MAHSRVVSAQEGTDGEAEGVEEAEGLEENRTPLHLAKRAHGPHHLRAMWAERNQARQGR